MNLRELEIKLIEEGYNRDIYECYLEYPNEAYTIHKGKRKWEVYYSERGSKSNLKTFLSEKEACEYFYQQIKKMK